MAASPTDVAAETIVSSCELLGRVVPGGLAQRSAGGVLAMVSRALLPSVNGIISPVTEPDPAEIAALAPLVAASGLPWSIQLRTPPGAEIARIAAAYGLTAREEVPLMYLENLADRGGAPAARPGGIRVVGGSEAAGYIAALAAGFELPAELLGPAMGAETLDAAGASAYLVEQDGAAVGTGFSALAGAGLALFSISTVPAYRHQGLGRAVTEAMLRDGARDGATLAALQPSEAGFALYESMGFLAAEIWTVLLPG